MELKDHDRPLNARGKRDAPVMAAKFLEQEKEQPVLISSTAKRAYATAVYFAKHLDIAKKAIIKESSLYHGYEEDFASVLFEQLESINSVMIFAHNPGLTFFANNYSEFSINNVPTTGIFRIESTSDKWVDFFDNAKLTLFIYPKMFL